MTTKSLYSVSRSAACWLILLLLAVTQRATAQLCTGSLGDPVVSIDFGAGTATFAGALPSGTTNYTYVAQSFPNDGYYTVENTTAGAGSVWWSTTDHTGNTGGYMMVVNASTSVTDYFYKKAVTGLCGGTTYEFAAWVVNLLRSSDNNPPNVTFSILTPDESTVIQSYSTGSIPRTSSGPVWKQFGFFFTTPAGVSDVVIKISNSSPGGAPANDLALDDITFRPCGPSVNIAIADGTTTKRICKTDNSTFQFSGTVSPPYTDPAYQWQLSIDGGTSWTDISGATTTSYTRSPTGAGTFLYRLVTAQSTNIGSASCRVASTPISITVLDNPDTEAASNNPACEGETLNLTSASGAASYSWTGPNGFTSASQNPTISDITTAVNGTYTIAITTTEGCANTGTVTIAVNKKPVASAGADIGICEGSSTLLQGSGGTSYEWTPATGLSATNTATTTANPTDSTTYTLTVSNGLCTDKDDVNVFVWKKPAVNAGADQRDYEGTVFQLSGTASGTDVTYYWSPPYNISNTAALSPTVWPVVDTTYVLHVTSPYGCGTVTDAVFIKVYKRVTVPNAFSPNADGNHDTWAIDQLNVYPEATLSVFNRYGQRVFSCRGYDKEWDGTANGVQLPAGTYYYVIDLKTELGGKLSGWVLLIR
ncbi:gliding motility-associated C-terminal domain-containing protein [Filimonas effusa]|nr:gliding motility-associated C-terminal domain-containing protein [Filimonas effusa]